MLILFNIFINDILDINSLLGIKYSITIYSDDVQLLFSGTPNSLEQLKAHAGQALTQRKIGITKMV